MGGIFAPGRHEQRQRCEHAAEQNGGQNDTGRPDNEGWNFQRHHAGIMHRRDTGANDRTADHDGPAVKIGQRDREANRRDHDRKDQRKQGRGNVVRRARTGIVSQHGDEMGGPNSTAADDGVHPDPDQTRPPRRRPRALEQAESDGAGEQTDGTAEHDQPPIMLRGQAIQDLIHNGPPTARKSIPIRIFKVTAAAPLREW